MIKRQRKKGVEENLLHYQSNLLDMSYPGAAVAIPNKHTKNITNNFEFIFIDCEFQV